ncbi:MAG: EI24 domain-containing protein [Rhizomicrobium sp.]
MFASLRKAAKVVFDPAFSRVVTKALLLSLILYGALFVAVWYGVHHLPMLGAAWVNDLLAMLAMILMVVLPFFLGAPVAAFFGSFFLDEIAAEIEARYYPTDPPASGAAFGSKLHPGIRLALLIVGIDLVLLPADVGVPGIGEIATIIINGWLLGREYFELVALRHISRSAVDSLRRRHRGGLFAAGIVISLATLVPIVNLLAPLFAAAFMVHMFKRYAHEDRPV